MLKKRRPGVLSLFVATVEGRTLSIEVDVNAYVSEIMSCVESKLPSIPKEDQRLIYGGKQLDAKLLLREYSLPPNATLHLVLRLPGGSSQG